MVAIIVPQPRGYSGRGISLGQSPVRTSRKYFAVADGSRLIAPITHFKWLGGRVSAALAASLLRRSGPGGTHREAGPGVGKAQDLAHDSERVVGVAPPVGAIVVIPRSIAHQRPRAL